MIYITIKTTQGRIAELYNWLDENAPGWVHKNSIESTQHIRQSNEEFCQHTNKKHFVANITVSLPTDAALILAKLSWDIDIDNTV